MTHYIDSCPTTWKKIIVPLSIFEVKYAATRSCYAKIKGLWFDLGYSSAYCDNT